MKKILVFIVAVMMIVALSACAQKPAAPAATEAPTAVEDTTPEATDDAAPVVEDETPAA